jgi:rhodanese-related sulfurtransferase
MKSLMAALVAVLLSLFAVGAMAQVATEEDVPRITKEELKALLGRPDVVILDVRLEDQWKVADRKIPGALHEDPAQDAASWLNKYPKDKTVVLY